MGASLTTQSLKNANGLGAYAAGTGSIILTPADANFTDGASPATGTTGEQFVLIFSGSNEPAVSTNSVAGITGSVVPVILAVGSFVGDIVELVSYFTTFQFLLLFEPKGWPLKSWKNNFSWSQ